MVRVVYIFALLLLSGCKYSPFSSSTCSSSCPPQLFSSQGRHWDQDTLSKLSENLTGYLESSVLGSHKAVWLDVASQKLVISMPSPNVFLENWSTTISDLPGTQIRAYEDSQQHSFIEIRYPLYLLSEKFEKYTETKGLPSGEPLPGVPQGRLPVIDIPMDKNFRSHLFFGEGTVALLVDVQYDPMLRTSLPIKKNPLGVEPDNILGYVSTVPKETLQYGGIFISVVIPTTTLEIIRK